MGGCWTPSLIGVDLTMLPAGDLGHLFYCQWRNPIHMDDDSLPKIPESVVSAAEQINRGESVSKGEVLSGLAEVSDSDEE